jgi:hypothetical protein
LKNALRIGGKPLLAWDSKTAETAEILQHIHVWVVRLPAGMIRPHCAGISQLADQALFRDLRL